MVCGSAQHSRDGTASIDKRLVGPRSQDMRVLTESDEGSLPADWGQVGELTKGRCIVVKCDILRDAAVRAVFIGNPELGANAY